MSLQPTRLSLDDQRNLVIDWSDGSRRSYTVRELRDACPCATCRERRRILPEPPSPFTILRPEEARPLTITGMEPVGSYAYKIVFSDGHDTGLFTLESLRELGTVQPA
jgi:DUF971 family protein